MSERKNAMGFLNKKRIISILCSMFLLPFLLVLSACGDRHMSEETGGNGVSAQSDSESVQKKDALFENIKDDGEKIMKIKEILKDIDNASASEVTGIMSLYASLRPEKKAELSFDEYTKLADAEYKVVNSEKLDDIDSHKQDVLAAVAMAYYNQSYESRGEEKKAPQILYDQYNTRRNFNPLPEDATELRNLYLDCSSFVNSVYYYTFGVNLLPAGKSVSTSTINTDMASQPVGRDLELMYYFTGHELESLKASDAKAQLKFNEIKEILEPGDIINYRRESTGHVIMYLGEGKFIHSTGTANPKTSTGLVDPGTSIEMSSADEAKFGTVNIDSWDRFFTRSVTPKSQNDGRTGTSNNYLFHSNITAVAVFRPLNRTNGRMKGKALTTASVARYLYQGLDIEKSSVVRHGDDIKTLYYGNSVFRGDEICVTLKIANRSHTEIKPVSITELIPESLEFVTADPDAVYYPSENALSLHIAGLESGESYSFTYTLKVKIESNGGTVIDDFNTYVNGIRSNRIIFQVFAVEPEVQKLDYALKRVSGTSFSDGYEAVKAFYANLPEQSALEALKKFSCPSDVISKLFPANVSNFKTEGGEIAVRVLYGGYKVGSAEISVANRALKYDTYNLKAKRVLEKYLADGDIIITYSEFYKRYDCRLYYAGALYGTDKAGVFGQIEPLAVCSGGRIQDYLDTLTAYNAFVILRPFMAD